MGQRQRPMAGQSQLLLAGVCVILAAGVTLAELTAASSAPTTADEAAAPAAATEISTASAVVASAGTATPADDVTTTSELDAPTTPDVTSAVSRADEGAASTVTSGSSADMPPTAHQPGDHDAATTVTPLSLPAATSEPPSSRASATGGGNETAVSTDAPAADAASEANRTTVEAGEAVERRQYPYGFNDYIGPYGGQPGYAAGPGYPGAVGPYRGGPTGGYYGYAAYPQPQQGPYGQAPLGNQPTNQFAGQYGYPQYQGSPLVYPVAAGQYPGFQPSTQPLHQLPAGQPVLSPSPGGPPAYFSPQPGPYANNQFVRYPQRFQGPPPSLSSPQVGYYPPYDQRPSAGYDAPPVGQYAQPPPPGITRNPPQDQLVLVQNGPPSAAPPLAPVGGPQPVQEGQPQREVGPQPAQGQRGTGLGSPTSQAGSTGIPTSYNVRGTVNDAIAAPGNSPSGPQPYPPQGALPINDPLLQTNANRGNGGPESLPPQPSGAVQSAPVGFTYAAGPGGAEPVRHGSGRPDLNLRTTLNNEANRYLRAPAEVARPSIQQPVAVGFNGQGIYGTRYPPQNAYYNQPVRVVYSAPPAAGYRGSSEPQVIFVGQSPARVPFVVQRPLAQGYPQGQPPATNGYVNSQQLGQPNFPPAQVAYGPPGRPPIQYPAAAAQPALAPYPQQNRLPTHYAATQPSRQPPAAADTNSSDGQRQLVAGHASQVRRTSPDSNPANGGDDDRSQLSSSEQFPRPHQPQQKQQPSELNPGNLAPFAPVDSANDAADPPTNGAGDLPARSDAAAPDSPADNDGLPSLPDHNGPTGSNSEP